MVLVAVHLEKDDGPTVFKPAAQKAEPIAVLISQAGKYGFPCLSKHCKRSCNTLAVRAHHFLPQQCFRGHPKFSHWHIFNVRTSVKLKLAPVIAEVSPRPWS